MKRWIRGVSVLVGGGFLAFAFSKVPWASFIAALSLMNWAWMLAGAGSILAAMYLRSLCCLS